MSWRNERRSWEFIQLHMKRIWYFEFRHELKTETIFERFHVICARSGKYPWARKEYQTLNPHLKSNGNAWNMLRTLGRDHYLLVLILLSLAPPFELWVCCNILMRLCKHGRERRGMVISIMMLNDFTGFQTHREHALWIKTIEWQFNYELGIALCVSCVNAIWKKLFLFLQHVFIQSQRKRSRKQRFLFNRKQIKNYSVCHLTIR